MDQAAPLPEPFEAELTGLLDAADDQFWPGVAKLCEAHPDRAAEIRSLARAIDASARRRGEGTDASFASLAAEPAAADVKAGDRIGPFAVLAEIGHGGMGSVFLAEQKEPVQRRVALKVIKLGMDTRGVLARFEAERQALARMDHPHIAKVFEAGATANGRPYFAMEYVKGVAITRYCDDNKLSLDERLRLFQQVCSGVQHAHGKGVIHRDLTPNNVLVMLQDAKPSAKIIDFGLARATDHRLTEKTLFTEQGVILGTPEYMSPEQAGLDALDVDVRSDVYTLGVLLYELLTGKLPFEPKDLRAAGYDAMCKTIRESDPPRPSTKVTAAQGGTTGAAQLRRTDAGTLLRRLRGDLDWIVMKCLEKDRTRRYETASELAADVQRHLDHEPVLAHAPSAAYRLAKFARRYRGQLVAAGMVFVAVLAGLVGTTTFWLQAKASEALANRRAEDNALLAQQKSDLAAAEARARLEAQQNALAAEQRAKELEQVLGFQESQWSEVDTQSMGVHLRREVLAGARESKRAELEGGLAGVNFTDIVVRVLQENLFDRTLAAIASGFGEQPLVKARLFHSVANALRQLGRLQHATGPQAEALEIRRRVLGDEHEDTLSAINGMATLLQAQGHLDGAEPLFRAALEARRRVFGNDHRKTLSSVNNLAGLLEAQGKFAEAAPLFHEAMVQHRRVLGEGDPDTLTAIDNMGTLLHAQGKLDEAEPYLREALAGRRKVLGDDHPHTLNSITNLAVLARARGRLGEAESLHREALAKRRAVLGDDHPDTLTSINSMGDLLRAQGQFGAAEPLIEEAWAKRRQLLGDDHPATLTSLNNLGVLRREQGKLALAEAAYRAALDGRRRVLGDDHPDTLTSLNNLGGLLRAQGKYREAEPLLGEVMAKRRRLLGEDHPDTLASANNLGGLLQAQGKLTEAEQAFRDALGRSRRILGDDHRRTLTAMHSLGAVLQQQAKFGEAEALHREALERCRRALGAEHGNTLESTQALGGVLVQTGRCGEAVALLAAAEDTARRVFSGSNAVRLASFLQTLGKAHAGLTTPAAFAAGEARLLEAHRIVVASVGSSHGYAVDCARALAGLYDAWHAAVPNEGHDQKAADWRARIEASRTGAEKGRAANVPSGHK